MSLVPKQKQHLKALAHKLKPVVLIGGNGFTDAVKKEIDRALNDHQLIKVRVQTEDRDSRRALFNEICTELSAEPVQLIGSVAVIYRKNS